MSGDVIIGGLFDIHIYYKTEAFNFSSPPHLQARKISMLLEDFYNFLSLVFAVDEINLNPNILPNVTLGYNVYDSYVDLFRTIQGAVRMYSGNTKQYPNYNCDTYGVLAAVIEGMASSFSIQYANIFGIYKYPQVSFMSQEPLQSNKLYFPFFYRTVPSEKTLYSAVIALLKHFGWMWVGIIYPDDDGSINAIKIIKNMIEANGGCIEFIKLVPSINDFSPERIKDIQQTIVKSTANVILVYGSKNYVYYVELNVHISNIPGKVWIHTADSSFRMFNSINDTNVVNGSLRFVMQKTENPEFIKFIQGVNPSRFPTGRTFTTWWDELCENRCPFNPRKRNCTGVESGRPILYSHCNLKFTGMSYIVYNSVYAVAYALNDLYKEIPLSERLLDINKLKFQDLKGWKLHKFLKKINFTNILGQDIFFSDGEISVGYDTYNVIHNSDLSISSHKVGNYYFHAPPGKQLILNASAIVWENKFTKIPRSLCSDICQPGNRKSIREGQPVCCYDCLSCPEGQFSNRTDADVCTKCPEDEWPNEKKTKCTKKNITFLSYENPIGIVLTFIAIVFALLSAVVLLIFIRNRHTPIVKANNRDLSYLILLSLMLSCLSCTIFIERPERVTCFLRQAIFGITFAISVSSLLAKTLIVVIAFNATKPGKNLRKWVGAKVPKYIVFTFSIIQLLICITWLFVTPPSIYYNKESEVAVIIVECDKASAIAFYIILGYLCILASICFIVAFFARKLPDTFNDAKLITFSMLVFFTVWAFFIPTYLSAKGTSTVAVEVFAILASSSGMLSSIFAPKCYIILVKPQINRKNFVLKGSI
ncbi:extracellular calcium-sensing receptor-like [Dendropsophus ebraccatus]|uniref:extracellular calcium-sensing receptor-like n=1 Tax=Dendropsophus ebraccatus TaxID=150705 RepID=UPI003831ED78